MLQQSSTQPRLRATHQLSAAHDDLPRRRLVEAGSGIRTEHSSSVRESDVDTQQPEALDQRSIQCRVGRARAAEGALRQHGRVGQLPPVEDGSSAGGASNEG